MSFIPQCMGRKEFYYSYDYFSPGGFSLAKEICKHENLFTFVPCAIMQIFNLLIWSNILDIYMLVKIAFVLKSHTNSVQNLLTPMALVERQR